VHDVTPVLQKFGGNVFHVSSGATAATRKADDLYRLIRGIPGKAATPLAQRPKALAAATRSVSIANDDPNLFHPIASLLARVTEYEKVPPSLLIKRGAQPEPDDFRGEQALFFNVKGKGLVVLSGCAHAGIVNTVKHAQKVSGIEKLHAVMGGFHLINAKAEVIQKTVADIKSVKPDFVVPTHCTGFEAIV
jgi:hypothetical protein